MNRPRILHLRASNFVGGPEHQLLRYTENDSAGRYANCFGVFAGPQEGADFLKALQAIGVETVEIRGDTLLGSLRSLLACIKKRKIDAICSHGYKADVLGILAAKRCNIPIACFLRGWTGENAKVRMYEALDRFSISFADKVVCLSKKQSRRIASRKGLASKIHIVPNSIDLQTIDQQQRIVAHQEIRRRFALPEQSIVVASAGRLSPEKGVEDLLNICPAVCAKHPDVRFLIFGDGPLRQKYAETILQFGLNNSVSLPGFQPDLRVILPGVDILVNPSHTEEIPNIVLEGMAAGIPVIATRVGGVEEIAGPENALCLVEPKQPNQLAASIESLLNNPSEATALAQAGHSRVSQAYSVEQQRKAMNDLYEQLIYGTATFNKQVAQGLHLAPDPNALLSSSSQQTNCPSVSIVIPVRNEALHIAAVLQQLETQDYPHERMEVLVADGNSTDHTCSIVEDFAKGATISIRCLPNPKQLSSAGRNVGALEAKGDFVLFIDGHCFLPSQSLVQNAVRLFEKNGADCLSRPQPLSLPTNTVFQNVLANVRSTRLGHGADSTIYNTSYEGPVNPSSAGALYRKSVFEKIGYYDEDFDAAEDVEFNTRVHDIGLKSLTSPTLAVFYHPRKSLASLWKQMLRYGRGRFQLMRKHPHTLTVAQLAPAIFLAWLICGAILSIFFRPIAIFYLLSLALYLSVVLGFSVSLAARFGFWHLLIAPLIYPVIHLGLGAGFLGRWVSTLRKGNSASPNHSEALINRPDPSYVPTGVPERLTRPPDKL